MAILILSHYCCNIIIYNTDIIYSRAFIVLFVKHKGSSMLKYYNAFKTYILFYDFNFFSFMQIIPHQSSSEHKKARKAIPGPFFVVEKDAG